MPDSVGGDQAGSGSEAIGAQHGQRIHARRCLTDGVARDHQDTGRLVAPAWLRAEACERGGFPTGRLRREPCEEVRTDLLPSSERFL